MDFRRQGGWLPPDFAVAHYLVLYYPSFVLGDDEFLGQVTPLIRDRYGQRDAGDRIGQWEACNAFESLRRSS